MVQFRNLLKRCVPLILALVLVISLFPAVPVSAATSTIPFSFIHGYSFSYSVGSSFSLTANTGYVVTEPVSVEFGSSYSIDYYSPASSFAFNIVGFDDNDIVTERFYVHPGSAGSLVAEWTPSVESTTKLRLRLYVDSFDECGITELKCSSPDPEVSYNYIVDIDGSSFAYSTTAESITLDLIITANDYKISVDGSEEDYRISDTVLNNDKQKFAGLSVNGVVDQVDYGIGTHTITLDSSNPTLLLGTVWKYPLYVDPNGGTWNGSSSTSVFWELPNTDTDEINDPVRSGYTFTGWTFTGDGEFNDAGNPPYNYEHGTAPGYLTANWEGIPTYTHTISIDGSSYTFTAENAAPPVTIQVTSTGFTMSYGETTKTWTYSGSDSFVGIRDSSGNSYDVGAYFSLLGLSGANKTTTIVPLTEVEPSVYYSTLIKVYDSTGNNLLTSFVASSAGSCPAATLIIADSFLCFDASALETETIWDYTGEGSIAGISLTPNASSPTYTPGDTMTFGGLVGQSHVVSVYIVEDEVVDPTPDNVLTATFVIGGQSYVFTGTETALPEVTMDVLFGGVRLYDGTTSYFHENESILGYKLSEDAESYIAVGESHLFSARSISYTQTLFPVYSADLLFSATVNIYNSTGTQLLGSYDFSAQGSAPVVTLTVLGNGCKIVSGDTAYSWDSGSDPFYGFSPAMYVAAPYYVPGNVYTLPGGDAVNLTIDLYVHDTESSGLPALDFVDWLKSAVGGFLDFEIFPGLALDEILYFILVVQLLLWFLRVIT